MKAIYTSIACNRLAETAAHAPDEPLIAFGADHHVAFLAYHETQTSTSTACTSEIVGWLNGHTGRVNAVRWFKTDAVTGLVSVSVDKTIRLWRRRVDKTWVCDGVLANAHTASVSVLSVLVLQQQLWIATGGSDGLLLLTQCKLPSTADEPIHMPSQPTQTIQLKSDYALSVDMSILPHSQQPILAVGTCAKHITLYLLSDAWQHAATLKGHTDWVRSLAFALDDTENTLFLASASQDKFVRLWQVERMGDADLANAQSLWDKANKRGEENLQLSTKAHIIKGEKHVYTILLHALLTGHENWVYGIKWQPPLYHQHADGSRRRHQPMQLISCSSDKMVMLWRPDEAGVWVNRASLGEMGGHTLGFYGAMLSLTGKSILGHGFFGAWHVWSQQGSEQDTWTPQTAPTGHFEGIKQVKWHPTGDYCVTVSSDKSTRVFHTQKQEGHSVYHEMCRPQVHGYEMQCVAFLDEDRMVTGAEEKILRVFKAPSFFRPKMQAMMRGDAFVPSLAQQGVVGAQQPALGLTNKAIRGTDQRQSQEATDDVTAYGTEQVDIVAELKANAHQMGHAPLEEDLLQFTLWPELDKLYGHGNELFAVDVSPDAHFIASASKSVNPEQAGVRIWQRQPEMPDREELPKVQYLGVQVLAGPTLTVTKVRFSPDGQMLLATCRDRSWHLYQREDQKWTSLQAMPKAHSRILWDGCWLSSDAFVTVSRDKSLSIWERRENTFVLQQGWKEEEAITAVDAFTHPLSLFFFCLFTRTSTDMRH